MGETYPVLFDVSTPLGFSVWTSPKYWQRIISNHPDLGDRLDDVRRALSSPTEIRRSKTDSDVFVFCATGNAHWIAAVVRQIDREVLLVTAYRTDAVKEGEKIWPK